MKNLLQLTLLVAALAGLSACATGNAMDGASKSELAACQERVARLEEMNRSCYRK